MHEFKKILVMRTDRIGDVVLSTPFLASLRSHYPQAHISFMVRPYVYDLVRNNPHVNEILLYDKDKKHKGLFSSFFYATFLKRKKFDLVFVLHPTLRVHLLSYLARIPMRVGYSKKGGEYFLNYTIEDEKHEGIKHEYEYNFDLLDAARIRGCLKSSKLFVTEMPLVDDPFKDQDYIVIHPFASCPSKIWSHVKFKELISMMLDKWHGKIILIGQESSILFDDMNDKRVVNLIGKLKLDQLAHVLRYAKCLVSNDSGPVHIASAVETPSVVIFGRNNKGLSPIRWGPTYSESVIIHKDVGCEVCLAHKCQIHFKCLEEISVPEVSRKVFSLLQSHHG